MRYQKQKKAKQILNEIAQKPELYYVIHYSCESFYNIKDGRSPRITSIAVRQLSSGQTTSFSIHKIAEIKQISFTDMSDKYDELEREMLNRFFEFLKNNSNMKWIHWNMRDGNYGFQAIEHRYEVLKGKPFKISDENKIDMATLFIDLYGVGYVGHPRMESLMKLNKITDKDWLSGKDEAEAFDNQEYLKLHQSTLRKVDIIANLINRQLDGNLKTLAKWHEIYGISVQSIYVYYNEHWWCKLIGGTALLILGGIVGALIGKII